MSGQAGKAGLTSNRHRKRSLRSPSSSSEELDEPGPLVGILVGSESDLEAIDPALAELRDRGISHELKVSRRIATHAASPSTRQLLSCEASA